MDFSKSKTEEKKEPLIAPNEDRLQAEKYLREHHFETYKKLGFEHKINCICRKWEKTK